MKKRPVSLKDIATELGVSVSTVSRALKNSPLISTELSQKIRKIAELHNYNPNPLAMGLLRRQTRIIGIIVPDLVTHFYSSVISGIEEEAEKHGYYIIIASSNESHQKEIAAVKNLDNTRVEGIIACISHETNDFAHFERLVENEIPLVFFDRIAENMNVPSVSVDNTGAARKITRHFFENGYRRIAYISGPPHLNISKQRKQGYLDGLQECGLGFNSGYLAEISLNAADATEATRRLLAIKPRPDAIFGINDTVAFAAMKEIRKAGLKIPDDIGLVGFTDEFHSTVVDPSLTSVTHPTKQIGSEAVRLFFKRLEKGSGFAEKVVLPTELIIRESSLKK